MATDRTGWTALQIAWANHAAADAAAEAARIRLDNAEVDLAADLRDHNPDLGYPPTWCDVDDSRRAVRVAAAERDRAEAVLGEATTALHATTRLTRRQFADLLGINPDTLSGYVHRGQAPAPDGRDDHGHPWWSGTTAHAYAARDKKPGSRTRG